MRQGLARDSYVSATRIGKQLQIRPVVERHYRSCMSARETSRYDGGNMRAALRRHGRIEALAGVVIALLIGPAEAGDAASRLGAGKWSPWFELGGTYGSNDTSRGEAVLWSPFAQSQTSILFGEARGKLFEDDMREGNFALGYRQMMPGGRNLGVWAGYDVRESQHGNRFHQFAGGIEALSDRWDFRANFYLPLNDSENLFEVSAFTPTSGPVLDFTGTSIGLITTGFTTTTSQDELALRGFDAEIGAKIFSTSPDLTGPRHEFRVYTGAYHFDHSDLPNSATGPRLRTEWRMDDVIDWWAGSRLTLEAEYSHDKLRNDRVEVGARLRLPFGDSGSPVAFRSLTAQERRMSDGLERDTDIVTDTKTASSIRTSTATEAVEDAETSVRLDRVATVDATGNLTATSSTAGANSLIIADGSAGDIVGAQTLHGGQTLQGGGSTIQVRGVTSGIVVAFTAPGTRPTFLNTTLAPILTIGASNTRISGVNVEGAASPSASVEDNPGILGRSGLSNIHISDVIINRAGSGIAFHYGNVVTVSDVSINDISGFGMFFGQENSFTISGATIARTSHAAITLDSNNSGTITDTTIIDAANNGLTTFSGNSLTVTRMTLENIAGNGIVLTSNNILSLNDSSFVGNINLGILISRDENSLSGRGNSALSANFTLGACWDLGSATTGHIEIDVGAISTCP